MEHMELLTTPRGAAAYRVSIPITIAHPLHETTSLMATRINITPAHVFVTSFVVLLNNLTKISEISIYVQQPPAVTENCIPLCLTEEASFRTLANEVAGHLQGADMFPIFIRFDESMRGLELELQQFSETIQPYVGYNPRTFERQEMLFLIENYRSLLKRFVALPDLPLSI